MENENLKTEPVTEPVKAAEDNSEPKQTHHKDCGKVGKTGKHGKIGTNAVDGRKEE